MIIGNSLEAFITESKFDVSTILPGFLSDQMQLSNDWHEILLCQGLGQNRIVIDFIQISDGEKSFTFTKGEIIMMSIGLDVSEKVEGVALLTISWPNELAEIEKRTFLEINSAKSGVWRGKNYYIIEMFLIERITFLKLDARK